MIKQTGTIIIIAFILGLDALAVSMSLGIAGVRRDFELRFAGIIGIFHVFMPLVGLHLGLAVGKFLGVWAPRAGALVLTYLAIGFLLKGYSEIKTRKLSFKEAKLIIKKDNGIIQGGWRNVLPLGLSVSIDALTAGFSLGTLEMPVALTTVVIGVVASIMALLGFWGGRVFSRLIGSYAQMVGGITLLGLAVKLFF